MSILEVLKDKTLALCRRYGAPVKGAVSLMLGALVPGGGLLVTAIDKTLDCVHETIRDKWEFDRRSAEALATQAGLERVEQALDLLSGDLQPLLDQVVPLVDRPEQAREVLSRALENDERCQMIQLRLGTLAVDFARMERKIDDVHDRQVELLHEMRQLKKRVKRLGKQSTAEVRHEEDKRGPSIYDPF